MATPLSPQPSGGIAVISGARFPSAGTPLSPQPSGGIAVISGEWTPTTSSWHIGSLRFGSTAVAGTAFTGWT